MLINLLKNAAHAIRDREDGRIALSLAIGPSAAEITVGDNGCGMTPELAERIWEPVFTTKGDEGTGLGLDIVKSIIESHGGQIACRTAPGAGAAFTIRLPLVGAANELSAADVQNSAATADALLLAPFPGLGAGAAFKEITR